MMTDQQSEALMTMLGSIVIITGEGDQGQNILAMAYVAAAIQNGHSLFQNDCSNQGSRLTTEAISSDKRPAELMRLAPDESVFVLANADCIPALTSPSAQSGPEWLTVCRDKEHMVVLTTVRGREYMLHAAITDIETSHVQVEAAHVGFGLFVTSSSGELLERLPMARTFIDHDTVLRWVRLSNGSYLGPSRPPNDLIATPPRTLVLAVGHSAAVRSTETPMPKHPTNSFLLTRIVKQNQHQQERITEIIGLIWLESVNKRSDEEMAILSIEWACEKWGIDPHEVTVNPDTTYPDGWARTVSGSVNIEVTKVQPRWPSKATLGALTAGTQVGKAPNPMKSPVIQCQQCGTKEAPEITDVHILPEHDENHVWTCTYPGDMVGPDWPENLTALSELRIDAQQIQASISKAVGEKTDLAKRFGQGKPNWLVLLIEGFPPVEGFNSILRGFSWEGLDGVFAILSDEFGSAIHGLYPDDKKRIVLLKCPAQNRHPSYHPGQVLVVRKDDGSMDTLREKGRDRGITVQYTAEDGTVLAESVIEPPQPFSHFDLRKGLRAARKILPYKPPTSTSTGTVSRDSRIVS